MFKALISLFLIAGAVLIFFTESKNYFTEIKILRKQASSYNETINTAKKVRSSIDKTLAEYNTISQENVDRINKMVPPGAESMKLVVQIDDMTRKKGLNLNNISTKETATQNSALDSQKNNNTSVKPVFLSMQIQGSYESFRSFVKELEKSLRLVDFTSVRINSASQGNYLFSVEAVSYWRKSGDKK